uniref:Chromo domain-containing protein n=1 Tax=Macrostomum lignano TaxID=282301 RepID=A0A1I8JR32_9PLAT
MSADLAETGVLPAGEDPANASMKPPPKRRRAATRLLTDRADLSAMPMPAASAGEAPPKPRQKKKRRDPSAGAGAATIDSLRSSLEKDRQDPLIELNTYDPSRSPKKDVKGGGTANQIHSHRNLATAGLRHDDDETAAAAPSVRQGSRARNANQRQLRRPALRRIPAASRPSLLRPPPHRWSLLSQQLPPLNLNEKFENRKLLATAEAEPEVDGRSRRRRPRRRASMRKKKQPRQQQPEQEQQQQAEEGATDEAGGVITEQPQPVGDATAATDAAAASTSRRFDAAGIADEGLIVRLRVHRNRPVEKRHAHSHPESEFTLWTPKPAATWPSSIPIGNFLLPVMTGECDFRRQGNTLPVWEEQLLIGREISPTLLKILMSFSYLKFSTCCLWLPYRTNRINSPRLAGTGLPGLSCGRTPLAAEATAAERSRLQLFEALPLRESEQTGSEVPYLFHWYQSRARIPYPSTLYVTVEEFSPNRNNEQVAGRTRSQFPLREQEGLASGRRGRRGLGRRTRTKRGRGGTDISRTISAGPARTLPTGTHGCSALRASHQTVGGLPQPCRKSASGLPAGLYSYTAAARSSAGGPALSLGKPEFNLVGSRAGIVYDLGWSRKSHLLVSASAADSA